jgi:hypothetical protein
LRAAKLVAQFAQTMFSGHLKHRKSSIRLVPFEEPSRSLVRK